MSNAPSSTPGTSDIASVGLRYSAADELEIERHRRGRGFSYRRGSATFKDRDRLTEIKALAIPPAWSQVRICQHDNGHLQAIGVDAKGRRQYRYHPQFSSIREKDKFHRMADFGRALPSLRRQIDTHLRLPGLPREKVLAAIIQLLESTLIRIGNKSYAQENKSYGLTTLKARHVASKDGELRFQFMGKSGRKWRVALSDRRIAKVVRLCQDLPGQQLFKYLTPEGAAEPISSTDVNAYLRQVTGEDITAKDFRTWAGTVMTATRLADLGSPASAKAAEADIRATIQEVAQRLGNTPTVCRQSYVHPRVFELHHDGRLAAAMRHAACGGDDSAPAERAVLALLDEIDGSPPISPSGRTRKVPRS